MQTFDAVVIGGGPAGVQAAVSARHAYPDKTVALIRREKIPLIPCGIPYTLNTLPSVEDDRLPDTPLTDCNVEIIIGEVINRNGKKLILKDETQIGFDKLVIALGSIPVIPDIPGADIEGVYTVKKDFEYLKELREIAHKAERIVIVGGGYIGVEFADELLKMGKTVSIIEMLPNLFGSTMDTEFSEAIEMNLKQRNCDIITNNRIQSVIGNGKVSGVHLSNGTQLSADMVFMSIGYRPDTSLAAKLGVKVDDKYGIIVDEYMRCSDPDVFAAGDCAITRNCFDGKNTNIMLASAAMTQGRIAGANLFKIKLVKGFPGTLGTFSTKIGDIAVGVTGMTEYQAKEMKVDYIIGRSEAPDRHPGKLPGASRITVKLVYAKQSHNLLGGQVMGGDSVGELTNLLSVMIQKKMTDMEIDLVQIGTHPLLTSSPIAYPVINATVNAIMQWINK